MKYIFVSKRLMYWRRLGKPTCAAVGVLLTCSFLVLVS
jgi:hypothetical protein